MISMTTMITSTDANRDWRDFYAVPIPNAPMRLQAAAIAAVEVVSSELPEVWASGQCWIAGGAIRDRLVHHDQKDMDLFFDEVAVLDRARTKLLANGWVEAKASEAAYQFRKECGVVLDLVRRLRTSPLETIQRFDFIACCVAVSPTHLVYHRLFEEQTTATVLRFNACPAPRSSVIRACRFVRRGWTMSHEDALWVTDEGDLRPFDNETSSSDDDSEIVANDFFEKCCAELRQTTFTEGPPA